MAFKLSKQEIVKEIVKCGKDPQFFIDNYCRISHPLRGLIPFKTYDYQKDLLKDFNDYRFNIILKARQLGISTISAGYIVWFMLFHRDKNILVVATKFGTAANLVRKVKSIMKHLPEWIKISKIDAEPYLQPSEDSTREITRKFLAQHSTKSPKNVTRKKG